MEQAKSIIEFIKKKDYLLINDNLGSGSFGKTVLLKDESIDELFVCKKYAPQFTSDKDQFYESFKKEIKIMYKLNHRNIVRIYNYYLYDEMNTGYIIMEYIQGDTIDKAFKEYSDGKVFLDVNDIFLQMINAFAFLESNNIIHRDIRFSNIMIDSGGFVKVIDFGLGKVFNSKEVSKDSLNEIINRYGMEKLPNEMQQGIYTTKTDMFCLAELFNRLLKTYKIKNFKYQNILNKMMESEADNRYSSFLEILNLLNNKQFQMLDISYEDKQTYLNFTNSLISALSCYTEDFIMEEDIEKILKSLNDVLIENCFEDTIVNNANLIRIFVKCGYRYYGNTKIETKDIKKFYEWLVNKDDNFRKIILNNIKVKLATVKTEIEDDLPF